MVQVVVAADATEAEEIQTILRAAGIESELENAAPDAAGLQDARARHTGRTRLYCPVRRARASFASGAPGTRGGAVVSEDDFGPLASTYDALRPVDANWHEL